MLPFSIYTLNADEFPHKLSCGCQSYRPGLCDTIRSPVVEAVCHKVLAHIDVTSSLNTWNTLMKFRFRCRWAKIQRCASCWGQVLKGSGRTNDASSLHVEVWKVICTSDTVETRPRHQHGISPNNSISLEKLSWTGSRLNLFFT